MSQERIDEAIDVIATLTVCAMALMALVKLVHWDLYPIWIFIVPVALATICERVIRFWYRRK